MADSARHILVVDDELPILDALAYGLRKAGFRVSVAANAEACMRIFREDEPELLVLDVMLPSGSGFEVCRRIRENHATPILMLTARTEEKDKVAGLEAGADDYVTKPFSVRELVARVNAILRRSLRAEAQPNVVRLGELVVDEARHEAELAGKRIDLAPKEFSLLAFMAKHPGIAFTRQTLLDRVWGADAFVDERTVDVHIRWLRSKIEAEPAKPTRLLTIRGVGYKLAAEHLP